jgi:hypothetical protein
MYIKGKRVQQNRKKNPSKGLNNIQAISNAYALRAIIYQIQTIHISKLVHASSVLLVLIYLYIIHAIHGHEYGVAQYLVCLLFYYAAYYGKLMP